MKKEQLDSIIDINFPTHPFLNIPKHANYKIILANYFAMSQAFPYLQAGSQDDLIFHYMQLNKDIPQHVELTTIVGNFLCWDETGGLYPTIALGLKALPKILETRRFHANILREDLSQLFNEKFQPDYSARTRIYLTKLREGLGAICPIERVACMVSFEKHANNMITALWKNISTNFKVEKKSLKYFLMHVGGDDPAEQYHVEMTNNLIAKIVPDEKLQNFFSHFHSSYALHSQWCEAIIELGLENELNKRHVS